MDPDLKDYLTHHSLEGIVVTDTEGTILQCNGTAYGILGYAEGELTGEFIGGIFPPPSTAHLLPNLIRMAAREGGFDGEIMLQDSDGHPVIVRLFADPFPRESPRRIIFRFLDWTEVQLIMKQLRESSQMAVLGSLTRSMAHEILNPISVIGAYTRRLLKSLPPGSGEEEWTSQVLANVEKLESLIETVQAYLDLPSPSFSQQSPDKVLDGALDCIREEAGARGIRLLEEGRRPLPEIYMDPALMERALKAVFLNAVERMPAGGDLTVRRGVEGGSVVLVIHDTGPVLDLSRLEEDLSPIHVLEGDRAHLNLAIARRIIDEHNGHFGCAAVPSGGLRLQISLPSDRRALARHRVQ